MKRVLLSFVAVLALLTAVETAKADWVFVVNSGGWVGWHWDPTFDDGTWNGGSGSTTPNKLPPRILTWDAITVTPTGFWIFLF